MAPKLCESDNSTQTSQAWRSRLSFQAVRAMQAACKTYMQLFGYVSVKTEQELNDLSHNLFTSYDRDRIIAPWD